MSYCFICSFSILPRPSTCCDIPDVQGGGQRVRHAYGSRQRQRKILLSLLLHLHVPAPSNHHPRLLRQHPPHGVAEVECWDGERSCTRAVHTPETQDYPDGVHRRTALRRLLASHTMHFTLEQLSSRTRHADEPHHAG